MVVPLSDLKRLAEDDWTISIGNWSSNEKNLTGKRYERLAKLVKDSDKRPFWIDKLLKGKDFFALSEKWRVIQSAIKLNDSTSKNNKTKK